MNNIFTDKRTQLLHSHVLKILWRTLFYTSLCGLFYLALVSVITFFHFTLGHGFSVIEDWAYRHVWQLVIISKCLAIYFILRFLEAQQVFGLKRKFFDFFGPRNVDITIWSSILASNLLLIFLSKYELNTVYSLTLFSSILNLIGPFFFYFPDVFVFYLLIELFPLRRKRELLLMNFSVMTIYYLFSKIIFPFSDALNLDVYVTYCFLGLIYLMTGRNIYHTLAFLLFFILPQSFLFAHNPLWPKDFSIFLPKATNGELVYPLVLLIVLIYLFLRFKKLNQQNPL